MTVGRSKSSGLKYGFCALAARIERIVASRSSSPRLCGIASSQVLVGTGKTRSKSGCCSASNLRQELQLVAAAVAAAACALLGVRDAFDALACDPPLVG